MATGASPTSDESATGYHEAASPLEALCTHRDASQSDMALRHPTVVTPRLRLRGDSGQHFSPCPREGGRLDCLAPALVAQWIEHLTTDQKVGGSTPSERAKLLNDGGGWRTEGWGS